MRDQGSAGCWKGMGCLFALVGLACLCMCGGGFGLFSIITAAITNSEPYQEGLNKAKLAPAVQQALGEPIEEGWFTTGSINVTNDDGECNYSIPISGPKGSGTLDVEATKLDGVWTFEKLEVAIEGAGEKIDLLE